MRKRIVARLLVCLAAGILAAGIISEISFRTQDNLSRPPQRVELVIPPGTAQEASQGVALLPEAMTFVAGDVLVVRNQDSTAHTLGELYIPAGSTATLSLDRPENLLVTCSFMPGRTFGLDVREALTLGTRLTGILLAGLPMGILVALYSLVAWPLKPKAS